MRHPALALLLAVMPAAQAARADQIVAPAGPFDPASTATFIVHLDQPVTAAGVLAIEWTDAANRVVERRGIPYRLANGADIPFAIDMRRSVVMGNTLTARLTPGSPPIQTSFIAPAHSDPWSDWQTILYQPRSPMQLAALRHVGLTGGMVFANRADPKHLDSSAINSLVQGDLRWYVENIATDFYAEYHRWRPGRAETADFDEAKRMHQQAPGDLAAFTRVPSLSDPDWLAHIRERLADTVQAFARYQPLYYSLADEPGIADLAAAWDFDFAPASLAGFRAWLQTQYPSLDALNQEWGSDFPGWSDVMPATTDQAMARQDDNFAAWADFKAWMDVAFARAVQAGTDAVHAADPHARAAIEGTQIPGWGGYDYSRLAAAVDVMEIYDFGQNVDIARSFNPALVMVSTLSGHDDATMHELWHSLLMGMRGVILWDEKNDLADTGGGLGETGRSIAPTLERLHDGLGALLIHSPRDPAPIAILYSPPSFRMEWMLDRRPNGVAWAARDAEAEYQDTAMRAATRGFSRLLAHLGLQGRFVSPQMLADGSFARAGFRALILPHVLAMSVDEAAAIRRFAGSGGLIIADTVPGAFDGHGRRQPAPPLADLFPSADGDSGKLFSLGGDPLSDAVDGHDPAALLQLSQLLATAGVGADLVLTTADGQPAADVSVYRYLSGATRLYALQRDFSRQPGSIPAMEAVNVDLPQSRFVFTAGRSNSQAPLTHLALLLDPVLPTLLAISDAPLGPPVVTTSQTVKLGQDAVFDLYLPGTRDGAVLHVEVKDPAGKVDDCYAANIIAAGGGAQWRLPLAANDAAGSWTVTATDMLSGQQVLTQVDTTPP